MRGRRAGVDSGMVEHYLSDEMLTAKIVTDGLQATPREEQALKLLVVLSRAQTALSELVTRDAERHGLTASEFGVLEALHHKGPMLLGELQRKILVSSGGITYLVDRLEDRGLVERLECPSDRRARYAALTDAGRELITRIFPEHRQAVLEAMSGLDQDQQRQATELLRRLGLAAASKLHKD